MSNPKLILGTVQMGISYGINNPNGKITLENSLEILRHAFANGISTLDTAEAYGSAHEIIGTFHKENPGRKFNIITKVPRIADTNVATKVYDYLKVLNIDTIDTLMFHAFATFKSNPEYLVSMIRLKEKGAIKNIGISVYTNHEFREVIDTDHFDVIQIPFNLFDNWSLRGELIEEAKAKGKLIHTRSAFLQGLFFMQPSTEHKLALALKKELETIRNIATKEQMSIASLALNYCLQNESIDNVLIGVDSVAQLKDNLEITGEKWSIAAFGVINNIKIQDLNLINPSLWN